MIDKILVTGMRIAITNKGELLTSIQREVVKLPSTEQDRREFLESLIILKNEKSGKPEFFDVIVRYFDKNTLKDPQTFVPIPDALKIIQTYHDKAVIGEYLKQALFMIYDDIEKKQELVDDIIENNNVDISALYENAKKLYVVLDSQDFSTQVH